MENIISFIVTNSHLKRINVKNNYGYDLLGFCGGLPVLNKFNAPFEKKSLVLCQIDNNNVKTISIINSEISNQLEFLKTHILNNTPSTSSNCSDREGNTNFEYTGQINSSDRSIVPENNFKTITKVVKKEFVNEIKKLKCNRRKEFKSAEKCEIETKEKFTRFQSDETNGKFSDAEKKTIHLNKKLSNVKKSVRNKRQVEESNDKGENGESREVKISKIVKSENFCSKFDNEKNQTIKNNDNAINTEYKTKIKIERNQNIFKRGVNIKFTSEEEREIEKETEVQGIESQVTKDIIINSKAFKVVQIIDKPGEPGKKFLILKAFKMDKFPGVPKISENMKLKPFENNDLSKLSIAKESLNYEDKSNSLCNSSMIFPPKKSANPVNLCVKEILNPCVDLPSIFVRGSIKNLANHFVENNSDNSNKMKLKSFQKDIVSSTKVSVSSQDKSVNLMLKNPNKILNSSSKSFSENEILEEIVALKTIPSSSVNSLCFTSVSDQVNTQENLNVSPQTVDSISHDTAVRVSSEFLINNTVKDNEIKLDKNLPVSNTKRQIVIKDFRKRNLLENHFDDNAKKQKFFLGPDTKEDKETKTYEFDCNKIDDSTKKVHSSTQVEEEIKVKTISSSTQTSIPFFTDSNAQTDIVSSLGSVGNTATNEMHENPETEELNYLNLSFDAIEDLNVSDLIKEDVIFGNGIQSPVIKKENLRSKLDDYIENGSKYYHIGENNQLPFSNDILGDIREFDEQKIQFWLRYQECLTKNEDGNLPIHQAVLENNLEEIQRQTIVLLFKKIPIDVANSSGMSPLQLGVTVGCSKEIITVLLNYGADVTLLDEKGNNVIHLAAEYQRNYMFEVLLYRASYLKNNIYDDFNYLGTTPLMICVKKGNLNMTCMLLQLGADVNKQEKTSGKTILFYAAENNNRKLVEILLEAGADTRIKNFYGLSPRDCMFELDTVSRDIKDLIWHKSVEKTREEKPKRKREAKKNCGEKFLLKTSKVFRKINEAEQLKLKKNSK